MDLLLFNLGIRKSEGMFGANFSGRFCNSSCQALHIILQTGPPHVSTCILNYIDASIQVGTCIQEKPEVAMW